MVTPIADLSKLGAGIWDEVDALPFNLSRSNFTPVRTQYYGHGAFMGAAPSLIAEPVWRRILAFLMPDVFDAIAKLEDPNTPELMTMMENNPVLAAYGTMLSAQASTGEEHPNHLAGMEWDVFVDSDLVEAHAEAETPEEASAIMDKVLDTALIAHASTTDTVQENMGFSQYSDVRETPKTAFGGVEMDSWLDLFGRALRLARGPDFDALIQEMASEPRSDSEEACMLNTFAQPWSVEQVVAEHELCTRRPYISIIIDIKSLDSTPHFLSALVRHLNHFGVHVAVVGSFLAEEIAGVSQTEQRVGELVLPGPREVRFFHLVGDLRVACREGNVPNGQSVMFNGASLLDFETTGPRQHTFSPKNKVLGELDQLRLAHDLQIGFYVQEGDCEAAAAAVLADIIEAWPDTFALGFAWGGLRDEAGLPSGEVARVGFGGQALLVLVGKATPWELAGED